VGRDDDEAAAAAAAAAGGDRGGRGGRLRRYYYFYRLSNSPCLVLLFPMAVASAGVPLLCRSSPSSLALSRRGPPPFSALPRRRDLSLRIFGTRCGFFLVVYLGKRGGLTGRRGGRRPPAPETNVARWRVVFLHAAFGPLKYCKITGEPLSVPPAMCKPPRQSPAASGGQVPGRRRS
jgi:hypothetical protein